MTAEEITKLVETLRERQEFCSNYCAYDAGSIQEDAASAIEYLCAELSRLQNKGMVAK